MDRQVDDRRPALTPAPRRGPRLGNDRKTEAVGVRGRFHLSIGARRISGGVRGSIVGDRADSDLGCDPVTA
jgi:hypothetical protein